MGRRKSGSSVMLKGACQLPWVWGGGCLCTYPSGQGSQWSWAAWPLWVPAGQGLGAAVPRGQKCPGREADPTVRAKAGPLPGAQSSSILNPVPGGSGEPSALTAGHLGACSFPPSLAPPQTSPGGTCRARAAGLVSQGATGDEGPSEAEEAWAAGPRRAGEARRAAVVARWARGAGSLQEMHL